jgi:hypothetical protein
MDFPDFLSVVDLHWNTAFFSKCCSDHKCKIQTSSSWSEVLEQSVIKARDADRQLSLCLGSSGWFRGIKTVEYS